MLNRFVLLLILPSSLFMSLFFTLPCLAVNNSTTKYLANFDLVWNTLPSAYEEGLFLGNGEQGTNIWAAQGESLHFDIGDTRVYNDKSRAPIGKFILTTTGTVQKTNMRLSLYNGQGSGRLTTDKGTVSFKALTHAKQNLNLIEFTVSGDETINIEHFALPMADTGLLFNELRKMLNIKQIIDFSSPDIFPHIAHTKQFKALPKESFEVINNVNLRHVKNSKGSGYTLAWTFTQTNNNTYVLAWRTDYVRKNYQPQYQQATLVANVKLGYSALQKEHNVWWNQYFDSAYLSIPDKRIEANYWVQLYKMGAASGKGKLPIDLMGPWLRATPWPRIWANLNVQLSYLPQAVANKPNVAVSLADFIDLHQSSFIAAVPKEFQHDSASIGRGMSAYGATKANGELANFLWLLYDYWHFLRVYPDDARTVEQFYPLLKRGINFQLHHSTTDNAGIIHTNKDISPEYKWKGKFPKMMDTTYNLESLRWAIKTALLINQQFNLNDKDAIRYTNTLNHLAPLHIDDKTGIMLGEGVKVEQAHRHYSHLVGLYPLKQVDLDNPEQHVLYKKTVDHWINQKIKNSWSYKGYSRTGATGMYTLLDEPDEALRQLTMYMDEYLLPNTFYLETGPVIETPLSSAAATQELLIQSWSPDGKTDLIRLFPGAPKRWQQAHFDNLRAEGGYHVSASLNNGLTESFSIVAERNSQLQVRIKSTDLAELLKHEVKSIISSKGSKFTLGKQGIWQTININLQAGERLTFNQINTYRKLAAEPNGLEYYHFGLNEQSVRGKKNRQ